VREEKMAAQKKQQEDRIKKSIERSKAPVMKKTVIKNPYTPCRMPRDITTTSSVTENRGLTIN
jgi:hypothetical protein